MFVFPFPCSVDSEEYRYYSMVYNPRDTHEKDLDKLFREYDSGLIDEQFYTVQKI